MAQKRNDLEIYDQYAGVWWDGSERWLRVLQNMVPARLKYFERFAGDWTGKRVLDLGCGGGFLAEELARRGAVVSGLDPAEEAVRAANAHAASEGLEISYDVGIGEDLPYEDGQFDAVVCVDVLEHVNSVPDVLDEVSRVLRPDGLFLYDTINRTFVARMMVVWVAEDLLGLLPKGTHDPEMFIKPRELFADMERSGLVPGPITGLGPRGVNRRLDFTFGRVPLKSVIYMGTAVAETPGE